MIGARRLGYLVAALALVATACAGSGPARRSAADGPSTALARIEASPREDGPSALDDPLDPALPEPLVDVAELRSGGPGPDGIPAVDAPRFQRVAEAGWLDAREPVLALEIDGRARAYPVQVLVWHEIVNDTVAGVPVTVSYCSLCNTAIAFDRRVGDRVLDFGVSGLLHNSDLVMYDRQTESLWPQITGESVAGVLTGTELSTFPVQTVSWAEWREAHPRGWVLSRDTGERRDYGTNPYPGYDDTDSQPFLFEGEVDGRLTAMTRVVGIADGRAAVAIPYPALRERRVVETTLSGRSLVVLFGTGTASALDRREIAAGRDVGASGVFDPVLDGRRLHLAASRSGFRDTETGSTWDVLGRATAGPLEGRRLRRVTSVDSFWFAWAAFRRDTTVLSG